MSKCVKLILAECEEGKHTNDSLLLTPAELKRALKRARLRKGLF